MRDDARLHGEQLQHALAEGMNSLDLEAARRFQRAGEELAGALQQVGCRIGQIELLQLGPQGRIIECDPLAQALEQAVGHFGRRCLGEGKAHDAGRLAATQHEAYHAVDQNMGLAGSGIGIDPHGGGRIGSLELRDAGGDVEAHMLPPDSAHSWKRER